MSIIILYSFRVLMSKAYKEKSNRISTITLRKLKMFSTVFVRKLKMFYATEYFSALATKYSIKKRGSQTSLLGFVRRLRRNSL